MTEGGNKSNPERIASLDAFRGFDMFWIMGGEGLACAVAALLGFPDFKAHIDHVPWSGLHFMDTIFPTFLFVAGASFVFSCAKSLEKGLARPQIALKVLRRGLTLIALGLVYNAVRCRLHFADLRIPSVLGYIGFGWMCAAWIYLWVRSVKKRVFIAGGILAGVTIFFGMVAAQDAKEVFAQIGQVVAAGEGGDSWRVYAQLGMGPFTPAGHFGCYLDRIVFGRHALGALFDNEGFGGLLPTIVTAMLGMFAGEIVRRGGCVASGRKAVELVIAGFGCVVAGLALSIYYPIIKNVWSPSFVLVVAGYSFVMFALFYWIIDVKGWSRWSFLLQVIGLNAITIYMAQAFIRVDEVRDFFLGNIEHCIPGIWGLLVCRIGYVIICVLALLFLHKKKWYLKV